jgi:hypothetical protein
VTIGEICAVLHRYFPHRKPVRFVDPTWWLRFVQPIVKRVMPGRIRRVLESGEYYVPYFSANPQFDNSGTRAALAGTEVEVPSVMDYVETLLRYCVDRDWGRRPEPPSRG